MKKFVCFIFIAVAIIVTIAIASNAVYSEAETDYLRIHVRANSNSEVDQAVKYKVKDEVVKFIKWESLIRGGGWANTVAHSILTLGTGPAQQDLRWGNVPYDIGMAFPGIVLTIFPMLAIVFSRKKAVALIFSILNMILALLLVLWGFGYMWPLGVCGLAYAVVSLLLLLHAAGAIGNRKVAAILFFVMAGVCLILSGAFSCLQLRSFVRKEFVFVGAKGIQSLFRIGFWRSYFYTMTIFGVHYFPFSRAILYAAFGAGILFFGKDARIEMDGEAVKPKKR